MGSLCVAPILRDGRHRLLLADDAVVERVLGRHYLSDATLSNAASFVFHGTACLIRLLEFAA